MRLVLALALLICVPGLVLADRVALVIGNAAYQSVAPLDNPHNDADAVAETLRRQGFKVILGRDLGRIGMRNALREFRDLADSAEYALVYYAGHGIEIGGTNYLVPVDARLEDIRDAELEMVDLDLVLYQISGAGQMKMVVLDACRNNPFVARVQGSTGSRSISQGLGDIRTAQADTLIAYAAAAGAITPDGAPGKNSPFTAAFLGAMADPPADVRRVLGRVRDRMRQTVPGAAPFVYSSLGGGEYVINPRSSGGNREPAAAPAAKPGGRSISEDFVAIDRDGSAEDWNRFLVAHEGQSDHPLYAFALEKRQGLLDAERQARLAPAPAETPRDSGALSPPEEDTANTGSLVTMKPVAQTPVEPAEAAPDAQVLARDIQRDLKARGCYTGGIDGILGRGSQRAIDGFARAAGVDRPAMNPRDADQLQRVLGVLRAHPDADCPKVVRRTQPRAAPKASAPSTQRNQQPAVRGNAANTGQKPSEPERTSVYTRKDATKLMPVVPTDCLGTSKKWYDCD